MFVGFDVCDCCGVVWRVEDGGVGDEGVGVGFDYFVRVCRGYVIVDFDLWVYIFGDVYFFDLCNFFDLRFDE